MRTTLALCFAVVLVGCTGETPVDEIEPQLSADAPPTGRGYLTRSQHEAAAPINPARAAGNGITYHGGPVMLGTVNIYYIWYGNWSGNSATTILTDFITSLGGSPYENINTTYYNGSSTHVSGQLAATPAATPPTPTWAPRSPTRRCFRSCMTRSTAATCPKTATGSTSC